MQSCVYLGEPAGTDKCGGQPSRRCNLLSCDVVEGEGDRATPGCSRCKRRLTTSDPEFASKWLDPLEVIDRTRTRTEAVRNLLGGASVFLACGGPSANGLPLEELGRRGVWTMAVNNMAGHSRFRPQAFVCSDPPSKFSHSIWLDPAVMKWVPTPKMRGRRANLKRKIGPRQFELLGKRVTDCPNVWGFRRECWLWPDDRFFTSIGACWGNQNSGVRMTGLKKTVNTMLLAIRILRHLGASRVFLIGCDFRMGPGHGYAFDQGIEHKRPRDGGPSVWDNAQYEVVNEWLCEMQEGGVFRRFGMELFNCYERSNLRAFPYVSFERAIIECKGIVEDVPDLSEWYEKL